MGKYRIAVLLASYNRREKTLAFLASLFSQRNFDVSDIDIYLLDDASSDGTATAVAGSYPNVKVITGTGKLFWAGGMRTVWDHARSQGQYDLFLLFNDDVELVEDAVQRIISCYDVVKNAGSVIVGSTRSRVTGKLTYGGHTLNKKGHAAYNLITPDDKEPLPCHLVNGNVLLVDASAVEKIGILSDKYTHYLADFDYSMNAYTAGLGVFVAPGYYGYCEDDHGNSWLSASYSIKDRIKYLYNVKGLAYHEYLYYIKKHFPASYAGAVFKLWLKTLFPVIWDRFKQRG
ncbi:glycosyltransferase family 2 protein [Mucilaginibacter pallidiroseus]|uniref:glycosyltransferase family 2 protein n=1 Tax=Mucilaginibacter pallidiroseus TaxID=2599295 RepID=UPI001648958D|nr:glycosyltransferase family 2 protein [Mucilaginibacter pallidiroseus]